MLASFQYEAHVPISLGYGDVEQVEKPIQSSRGTVSMTVCRMIRRRVARTRLNRPQPIRITSPLNHHSFPFDVGGKGCAGL